MACFSIFLNLWINARKADSRCASPSEQRIGSLVDCCYDRHINMDSSWSQIQHIYLTWHPPTIICSPGRRKNAAPTLLNIYDDVLKAVDAFFNVKSPVSKGRYQLHLCSLPKCQRLDGDYVEIQLKIFVHQTKDSSITPYIIWKVASVCKLTPDEYILVMSIAFYTFASMGIELPPSFNQWQKNNSNSFYGTHNSCHIVNIFCKLA